MYPTKSATKSPPQCVVTCLRIASCTGSASSPRAPSPTTVDPTHLTTGIGLFAPALTRAMSVSDLGLLDPSLTSRTGI